MRLGKVGLQRDCLIVARQRIRGAVQVQQRKPAVAMRLGIVGLQRDCPVVVRQRLLGAVQGQQRKRAVVVCLGIVGLQRDGLVAKPLKRPYQGLARME